MSACSQRWLRLVRVLVACLAFFCAQAPSGGSAASDAHVDGIVLVARATAAATAREAPEHSLRGERSLRAEHGVGVGVTSACAVRREALALALLAEREGRAHASRVSLRDLVPHRYLRHCSLLC